jgi:hypothetical protein
VPLVAVVEQDRNSLSAGAWEMGRSPAACFGVTEGIVEHTIHFCKQTLGWIPRVRHPEQADRWTWLVLAAYT